MDVRLWCTIRTGQGVLVVPRATSRSSVFSVSTILAPFEQVLDRLAAGVVDIELSDQIRQVRLTGADFFSVCLWTKRKNADAKGDR